MREARESEQCIVARRMRGAALIRVLHTGGIGGRASDGRAGARCHVWLRSVAWAGGVTNRVTCHRAPTRDPRRRWRGRPRGGATRERAEMGAGGERGAAGIWVHETTVAVAVTLLRELKHDRSRRSFVLAHELRALTRAPRDIIIYSHASVTRAFDGLRLSQVKTVPRSVTDARE